MNKLSAILIFTALIITTTHHTQTAQTEAGGGAAAALAKKDTKSKNKVSFKDSNENAGPYSSKYIPLIYLDGDYTKGDTISFLYKKAQTGNEEPTGFIGRPDKLVITRAETSIVYNINPLLLSAIKTVARRDQANNNILYHPIELQCQIIYMGSCTGSPYANLNFQDENPENLMAAYHHYRYSKFVL